MKRKYQEGVGILEAAIALLVIALLAAVVVMAGDMVRQAEQKAVISEVDRYIQATQLFIDKFREPPGDYQKAETAWGSDISCPTTAYNSSPKTNTCNGNGDGRIGLCCYNTSYTYEWYRFWQHLANAKMIDGSFTGVGGNVIPKMLLNTSIPESRYKGGGYMMFFSYNHAITAEEFAYWGGHYLFFGKPNSACSGAGNAISCITNQPILTPKEAQDIDNKIDDGRPATGDVFTYPSTSSHAPNCANGNTTSAGYLISYDGQGCAMVFATNY